MRERRGPPGPPITVAVVSWNTRDLLASCLDALRLDVDVGRAQVWVVDNGSTDGSRELVRERYPHVKLLTPDANLGFGPAVNLVAARSSSSWLAAANADVQLAPGALERMQAALERAPRIGMVGPRLTLLDGSTQISVRPFPGISSALLLASHAARFSERARRALRVEGHWEAEVDESIPWLTGAFVLMSRAAFDDAGGFDPSQWLYSEDMDLCWRMRQHGWEIRWVPTAGALHAHSAATGQRFTNHQLTTHILVMTYLWLLRRRGAVAARSSAAIGVVDATTRMLLAAIGSSRDRAATRRAIRAELVGHLYGLAPRATLERRARARQHTTT